MRLEQMLINRTGLTPDARYLHFPEQERAWTYQEVLHKARQYAQALKSVGVSRCDGVGLYLPNSPEFVFTFFGNAFLGAVSTLLHPEWEAPEIDHALMMTEPSVVVTTEKLQSRAEPELQDSTVEHILTTVADSDPNSLPALAAEHSGRFDRPFNTGDDGGQEGVHLFTSGTTGMPKAAALSHRSWCLCASSSSQQMEITPADTCMTAYPLAHGNALIYCVLMGLAGGAEAVVRESFSAENWWDWCREHGVTQFNVLGGVSHMLYESGDAERENPVELVFSAGAPADIIEPFEEKYGVTYVEGYAQTEDPLLTITPKKSPKRYEGSIGVPIIEKRVKIVDEDGNECPRGETGEILTAGPTIMDRYVNAPEKTAETVGDGWVQSGDLGKMDEEGHLYFVNRKDNAIRRSGEFISSHEVERVVAEMEGVKEVVAVPVPDKYRDQEVKVLVQLSTGVNVDPAAIVAHCDDHLADFKVPRYVEFVDEFPRIPSSSTQGKSTQIRVTELREREREREMEPDHWDREADGV